MRIWSKNLIPYLPQKQLIAMRYELGDMIKQYPNIKNGLVKFANNYDIIFLYSYFMEVCAEMKKREINMNSTYNDDISSIVSLKTHTKENFQFNEDNEEYLKICLMNLYEKHIRNMIPKEEWQLIYDEFKEYLD